MVVVTGPRAAEELAAILKPLTDLEADAEHGPGHRPRNLLREYTDPEIDPAELPHAFEHVLLDRFPEAVQLTAEFANR